MIKLSRTSLSLHAFAARVWPLGVLMIVSGSLQAGPVPANLGAGLGDIVANRVASQNLSGPVAARSSLAVAAEMLTIETDGVMRDAGGRVLVNVIVDGLFSYDQVRAAVLAVPGLSVSAEERKYRAGIIEAYVPEDSVLALAKLRGISAIHAVNWPTTNVGNVTQQGVVQHRVDQLPATL